MRKTSATYSLKTGAGLPEFGSFVGPEMEENPSPREFDVDRFFISYFGHDNRALNICFGRAFESCFLGHRILGTCFSSRSRRLTILSLA